MLAATGRRFNRSDTGLTNRRLLDDLDEFKTLNEALGHDSCRAQAALETQAQRDFLAAPGCHTYQSYALAPDYLFARCGLARCLAREGNLEEAQALLGGLLEREAFHFSEYRSFLMTQRILALAVGDLEGALELKKSLIDLEQGMKD